MKICKIVHKILSCSVFYCGSPQTRILNSKPRIDVAIEILDIHLHPIRDWEDTILFYIERTQLTIFSLIVRYTMSMLWTPVLYFITTVIIEVYLHCFTDSVILRDIDKPTSRAEVSSPSSLYFKAEKEPIWGRHSCICFFLYLLRLRDHASKSPRFFLITSSPKQLN